MKKENPFSAYAVVSQVGFIVIVPLVLFSWGGSALVDALSLPGWLKIVAVLLGFGIMICSLTSYLYGLIRRYGGKDKDKEYQPRLNDRKDNDFYDDNVRKKL